MKAYWWRANSGMCNFGDEITSIVLSKKFSIEHELTTIEEADLISTGSILNKLVNNKKVESRKGKIHVVGSGLISPYIKHNSILKRLKPLGKTFSKKVVIHSVRGYLTQQVLEGLGERAYPIGDPGLLLPLIYNDDIPQSYKVGFIPHISTIDDPEWDALCERIAGSIKIDFRTDDLERVITQIKSCELILSQSLHGLILSDAYEIPNCWFYNGALHSGGRFKFYDYFSSVGRSFDLKFEKFEEINFDLLKESSATVELDVINKLQLSILKSYADALKEID